MAKTGRKKAKAAPKQVEAPSDSAPAAMMVHCPHDKLVPLGALKPHPKNRNKHPADQLERLARILRYQGWRYPVKVSKLSGFVTSGHGRIEAARLNGWKEAPVSFQPYEDEAQEYADVQADNAIASWAELDLAGINADIGDLGPDFDIDLLGIRDFTVDVSEKPGDPDAVPETPKVAKTKRGELWALGQHRVLCGDATSKEDLDRLMAGEKADMVFTDPPYNVDYDYNFHSDKRPLEEYLLWTKEWVNRASESLKGDAWFFAKNAPKNLLDFLPLVREVGWDFRNLIVWVHPPHLFPPGRFYDNWEAIAAFSRGDQKFNAHAETRTAERPISQGGGTHDMGRIGDVWEGIKYISAGAMKSKEAVLRDGTNSKAHPCQMPEKLPERAILFCSSPGDLIYEPFCGSGTTLIAAEKNNRRCAAFEIDPSYIDVTLTRWAKFTGRDPVREDGVKWSELSNG